MKKQPYSASLLLGTSLLFLAALFHRNSTLFHNPQFWAEDFDVYFAGDYLLKSDALLAPHNGFIQLGSRLIAYLGGLAPLSAIPWIYSYSFILAIVGVGVLAYTSSAFKGYGRPLAALVLIVAPVSSEVFLGMAYLHFTIGASIALALYELRPRNRFHAVGLVTAYAVVSFSSPFGIIALPFAALKAFGERTRYAVLLLMLSIGSAGFNLPHILGRVQQNRGGSYAQRAETFFSFFYGSITGPNLVPVYLSTAIGLTTMAALALYCWRHRAASSRALLYFTGYGFAVLAVSLAGSGAYGANLPSPYGSSGRYFLIPLELMLWTIISIESLAGKWRKAALLVTISAVLCFAHAERGTAFLRDMHWKSVVRCLKSGDTICPIQVSPRDFGTSFLPSVKRLGMITDRTIFLNPGRAVPPVNGELASVFPLFAGFALTQSLKFKDSFVQRLAFPVATEGRKPSTYSITWEIYSVQGAERKQLSSGSFLPSDYSDWKTVSLPVYATVAGTMEVKIYVSSAEQVNVPLLLPLFHRLQAAGSLPSAIANGKNDSSILGLTVFVYEPYFCAW